MVLKNTNASYTQVGFHYQDMVGLILLLDNLDEIDFINVEGTDDVDIQFRDKTKSYYQVKEVQNPNSKSTSTKLNDALKTLEYDSTLKNVKALVYVSNAYQPLGILKNSRFFEGKYGQYSFNELPIELKSKIENKITQNTKIDLNKLRIMRIHYSGVDDDTKQMVLNQRIEKFTKKADLYHVHDIKNEWINMISRSTEQQSRTISKKDFYAHTVTSESFSAPLYEKFFEEFDIDPCNEEYIKRTYIKKVTKLIKSFELINSIITSYKNFIKNEGGHLNRRDRNNKFVNCYFTVAKRKLNLKDKKDDDIAKLITWIAIRSKNISVRVKEAMNIDD